SAALLHMKPSGQFAPDLAVKWRAVDAGRGANKNFELTLRPGTKFADGSPLDAEAVAGWLNYFAKNSATYGSLLGPNPQFTASSKYVVRVALTVPTPNFFFYISDAGTIWGFVGSPRCVADPTQFALQNCGAGPFVLDPSQTVKGDHYTYVPNP